MRYFARASLRHDWAICPPMHGKPWRKPPPRSPGARIWRKRAKQRPVAAMGNAAGARRQRVGGWNPSTNVWQANITPAAPVVWPLEVAAGVPFLMLTLAASSHPFRRCSKAPSARAVICCAPSHRRCCYSADYAFAFAYRQQLAREETSATGSKLPRVIPILGGLLAGSNDAMGCSACCCCWNPACRFWRRCHWPARASPIRCCAPDSRARRRRWPTTGQDRRNLASLRRGGRCRRDGLFASGEAAGRLDDVIRHQPASGMPGWNCKWDTLAEWAP